MSGSERTAKSTSRTERLIEEKLLIKQKFKQKRIKHTGKNTKYLTMINFLEEEKKEDDGNNYKQLESKVLCEIGKLSAQSK